jgi:class 3 adenylate cyclase/predicted ATPase
MWGAAMDVGRWLRGLGLGQYEEKFRDNRIDADLLPRLTDASLKDIGVSAVGDRLRLLDAIAALAGAKPPADRVASLPKAAALKAEPSAERRPITVMFCDLVGSTSLAAKLDPEDWRNLVNAYLDEASKAVIGLGGHVLKKLGDGLMALFGYPQAQENDAERAVRAALAIQRALAEINAKNRGKGAPDLLARIGIESGPVVVEATGEVFGDAPNVAARVQAAAEPGSVLVTLNVQRQVAGLFVAEEQGARELKGVIESVQLFRIVRASGARRRSSGRTVTSFVGREEELGLLARRWEHARRGEGQLVLIVGDPGIGKSRLIEEFHARLAETPHTWSEWSASQLLQNTPLHPIAEWGRLRFGVDAPPDQRLADLENTLRLIGLDPGEHAPLIAPLVDIPLSPERMVTLAPEELRRRQLASMTALFLAGARSQPVVLAFEDLHWADPTSLDLLRALADRGAQAPLLLVATTRPEFRPPWSLRSHHIVISLSPLDRAGVAQMVGEISSRHALSREVVEGVTERTGGVPLFVEEVTRLLLERGEQGGVQAIPPTLQQSLAARLDRLGPAREVAQIGAVLGRDFAYVLLREVAEIDEPALQASLDRLADADLLFVEGAPSQASYRFKHALIQDAAYDSLLKSRRQALHRRAAEILCDDPERAAAEPEIIAHHLTQAGLEDLAIEWWGKAGDQALRRSAFQEAIAHLGKAIAMADKAAGAKLPGASGERPQLHVAYGNALFAARGIAAPETTEAFARAREAALGDKDAPERLAADYGLWAGSLARGELSAMRELSAAFLSDVEGRPDSPEAGVAHRVLGTTHWCAGEYVEARDHLERALALFNAGSDDGLAFRFGHDAGVAAMLFLAFTLWTLGDVGRAVSLVGDADARITGLDHVGTRAFTITHTALFALMRGDPSRATQDAVQLAQLTREHDLPLWRAYAVFLDGLARAQSGAPGDGLEDMRRGAELLPEQHLAYDGLLKIALAESEARAGNVDRALVILDEGLATSERIGYRSFEAELHRLRGEMLLKRDSANSATAEEALQTAIAVAKKQGTRSFQLRAALALAKLYQSTARPAEAHAILAPALEGFAPTPEMPQIAEAQALLVTLAATEEVKAAIAQQGRRFRLQTAYGEAMMWSKGFAADATKVALARAAELAGKTEDFPERFKALFNQWAAAVTTGELNSAQEIALGLLRRAEGAGRIMEAGVANRALGLIAFFHGDFIEARTHYELALDSRDPNADPKILEYFGDDDSASSHLAVTSWALGEVERARKLTDTATQRAAAMDIPAIADSLFWKSYLEVWRGDPSATLSAARALERVAREHGMTQYLNEAELHSGWARGRIDDPVAGAAQVRRVLAAFVEQRVRVNLGFYTGLLAQLEAETLGADGALARIDEAFRLSEQVEHGCSLPFLHRLRGEILLKRGPSDPAPAEEAFRTSIAIAKEQSARSPVLLASLALAKVLQSAGRLVEARVVLAAALEGFSPTSEMPEIAEAQALLAALAETDEVKRAIAQRQRRLDLQTSYGHALMWGKGYGAEETRAAFARVREFAGPAENPVARFAAYDAQSLRSHMRGEHAQAREAAEFFLREAEAEGRATEAGAARRALGLVCLMQGDLKAARSVLERALADYLPERDAETQFIFGRDTEVAAAAYLAVAEWHLGEVERARHLIERSSRRADELGHGSVIAKAFKTLLESRRNDASATRLAADAALRLTKEYGIKTYADAGQILANWANGRLLDPEASASGMRQTLAAYMAQGNKAHAPVMHGLVAELEVATQGLDRALTLIDQGLAIADETGEHFTDPYLFRLRGELMLRRDPANPAPAEEAFQTAIAIAKEQGARSYELLASLSRARLYQSTARPAEAHAILAPALEGFAPTPEMAEIAEAQALLGELSNPSVG